jgi:hypothetical protein
MALSLVQLFEELIMSNKTTPIWLTPKTRAQMNAVATGSQPSVGKIGYLMDDNKAILIGTGVSTPPLEYPEKTAIASMISTAVSAGGGSSTAVVVITAAAYAALAVKVPTTIYAIPV